MLNIVKFNIVVIEKWKKKSNILEMANRRAKRADMNFGFGWGWGDGGVLVGHVWVTFVLVVTLIWGHSAHLRFFRKYDDQILLL